MKESAVSLASTISRRFRRVRRCDYSTGSAWLALSRVKHLAITPQLTMGIFIAVLTHIQAHTHTHKHTLSLLLTQPRFCKVCIQRRHCCSRRVPACIHNLHLFCTVPREYEVGSRRSVTLKCEMVGLFSKAA